MLLIAEREARLMIMQCGVEIWANVCIYVCKMSFYCAPCINYAYKPQEQCATRFVAVLIWRDTDRMPLKSSESADGRVIGRGEWSPASRRCMYITPSIWRVNSICVLKKVRNTGSKPTFDSMYRYRHSHHLSTERLDCLFRG